MKISELKYISLYAEGSSCLLCYAIHAPGPTRPDASPQGQCANSSADKFLLPVPGQVHANDAPEPAPAISYVGFALPFRFPED
jgi:hypothetical protein